MRVLEIVSAPNCARKRVEICEDFTSLQKFYNNIGGGCGAGVGNSGSFRLSYNIWYLNSPSVTRIDTTNIVCVRVLLVKGKMLRSNLKVPFFFFFAEVMWYPCSLFFGKSHKMNMVERYNMIATHFSPIHRLLFGDCLPSKVNDLCRILKVPCCRCQICHFLILRTIFALLTRSWRHIRKHQK